MRKRTKKLALHRETLRSLVTEDLRRVGGAGETFEIITTCACTNGCGGGTGGCGGGTDDCGTFEIITTCVC